VASDCFCGKRRRPALFAVTAHCAGSRPLGMVGRPKSYVWASLRRSFCRASAVYRAASMHEGFEGGHPRHEEHDSLRPHRPRRRERGVLAVLSPGPLRPCQHAALLASPHRAHELQQSALKALSHSEFPGVCRACIHRLPPGRRLVHRSPIPVAASDWDCPRRRIR